MPDKTTPLQQLTAENDELRARLSEAEETLRAIRGCEADALVLSRSEGDYIHTLKGGLEPYRVMVESMNEGAVTLAVDGTILYCNGHFADWVKMPPGKIVGTSLKDMLPEQDREGFDAMLAQGAKGESRGPLTLQTTDGTQTPVLFSMCPLPQGEGKIISVIIADLSEVVAAAEARSRLALIVESSDDAIVSTTLDGIVESWNKAAELLYGYAAGEAIGRSIESLIVPPERINEVTHEFEALRRRECTLFVDSMRQRKDGTQVDVSVKACPIFDVAGKIIGASINSRDITGRKQIEIDLRESEQAYRTLSQNLPGMVYRVFIREGGRMQFFNEMPTQLTGYAADELIVGTVCSIEPLILDEDRPGVVAEVKRAIARQCAFAVEYRLEHKDGGLRWMQEHGMPVYGTDDAPLYIDGVIFDVTENKQGEIERKIAELTLQKSEKRLIEAMAIARIGYWEYEFATDEFIFNDQYYSLHKITAEEAGGYRMSSTDFARHYVYPEDAPEVGKHVRLAFETLDPDYFAITETRILSGKGEIIWVEVRFRIEKDLQGNTIKMVGVNQDITMRKDAEEVLHRTNRTLWTLSAGNLALLRAENEEELLQSLTSVIVKHAGYILAVVDYADNNPQKSITPIAWSGFEDRYFLAEHLSWADTEQGQLPVSRAIRSGTMQICHDITADPSFKPWRRPYRHTTTGRISHSHCATVAKLSVP